MESWSDKMTESIDDLKIGIRSSAIWFGNYVKEAIMFCYTCMMGSLIWVGQLENFGWPFYVFIGLSLIFIAHNINFLIAFDYQGQYFIESKRNFGPDIELWALRLNDNQNIMMRVGVSSGDGVNIDLQKGLFGVYFGAWSNEG